MTFDQVHNILLNEKEKFDDSTIIFAFRIPAGDSHQLRIPHPAGEITKTDSPYSPVTCIIKEALSKADIKFNSKIIYKEDKIFLTLSDFIDNKQITLSSSILSEKRRGSFANNFKYNLLFNAAKKYIKDLLVLEKFYNSVAVKIRNKTTSTIDVLPSLEGIFEQNNDIMQEYTYVCTFNYIPAELMKDIKDVLSSSLDVVKARLLRNYGKHVQFEVEIIGDSLIGKVTKCKIKPDYRAYLRGWIDRCLITQMRNDYLNGEDDNSTIDKLTVYDNFATEWKTKYDAITDILPELKGMFEYKNNQQTLEIIS